MRRPWFIEPAPHEVQAWLNYEMDDLAVYHAIGECVDPMTDETASRTMQFDGRMYDVRLSGYRSGLGEGRRLPEYTLQLEPLDGVGGPGDDTRTFTLKPRYPGLNTAYSPVWTGMSVHVQGVNEPLDAYPRLLRRGLAVFDVPTGGFHDPLPTSVITTYEVYVRVHRDCSGPLYRDDGVLDRLRETVGEQAKRDDSPIPGYHHRLTLPSEKADILLDGHRLGKRLKQYHPNLPRAEATALTESDPLAHPKVCVCFSKALTQGVDGDSFRTSNGGVRWDARDRLHTECESLLVNLLSWGGLSPRADERVYAADPYFAVAESARALALVKDPTPALVAEQEANAASLPLNPNLTPAGRRVLEALATHGEGRVVEVSERADCSPSTVYRTASRLADLVCISGGVVRWVSRLTAKAVRRVLAVSRADEAPETGADESAFACWAAAYGVSWDDPERDRLQLRFGSPSENVDVQQALRDGLRAWTKAGRDANRFRMASVHFEASDGTPTVRVPALG